MLYDPRWESPSLAGFKAWLERHDPKTTFEFMSFGTCAVGQYLAVHGKTWRDDRSLTRDLNIFASHATIKAWGERRGVTFGDVLREISAQEPAQ